MIPGFLPAILQIMKEEESIPKVCESFLSDANEQASGYSPKMTRIIKSLDIEKIGRLLTFKTVVSNQEEEFAGYTIPRSEDGLSHILFLRNGAIFALEPSSESAKESYKKALMPTGIPFSFAVTTFAEIVRKVETNETFIQCTATKLNARLEQIEQTDIVVAEAIRLARDLRDEEVEARKKTLDKLSEIIKIFDEPPKESPEKTTAKIVLSEMEKNC